MHGFQLSIILFDVMTDWHSEAGARCFFDELMLKSYCLNLDVKKTSYPNPVKINIIFKRLIRCYKYAISN